jgi:DUF1680 family protein
VYCVEQADVDGADPRLVELSARAVITPRARPDLLGGVTVLEADGEQVAPDPAWEGRLYRETAGVAAATARPLRITAIPYFAWANRDAGRMQVWLRQRPGD